jgi:hypothetical protein
VSSKWWGWSRALRLFPLAAYLLPLTGCAVTPLSNRIQVGEEAFVLGIGEGSDSMTDLYAAPAAGGTFVRLTFTRAEERLPRLSPEGTRVAFLRRDGTRDAARWSLVILDLRTTVERTAPLPRGAAPASRIGWTPDGRAAVVLAGSYYTLSADPGGDSLIAVAPDGVLAADSMTRELLGDPPVALVGECRGGGLCIIAAGGDTSALDPGATDAVRWGADSVAYRTARGFAVRPLAGGSSRWPNWSGTPSRLRNLSYHPGMPSR